MSATYVKLYSMLWRTNECVMLAGCKHEDHQKYLQVICHDHLVMLVQNSVRPVIQRKLEFQVDVLSFASLLMMFGGSAHDVRETAHDCVDTAN